MRSPERDLRVRVRASLIVTFNCKLILEHSACIDSTALGVVVSVVKTHVLLVAVFQGNIQMLFFDVSGSFKDNALVTS